MDNYQVPQRPFIPPARPFAVPPEPPKSSRKKLFIIICLALLITLTSIGALILHHKSPPANQVTYKTQQATTKPQSDVIRLVATGDWIAHDSVNTAAKQADGSYNYLPLVNDFAPIFKNADIKFCNDPILNGGTSLGISGYPKFNSPTEFVTDMGRLGCNLVNTASNHSFDFTQANIDNSVAAWEKVPNMLAVAGENRSQTEHDTIHYFTVKGVKFAFLAYTTYSNTDAPAQNNYGVNVFSQEFASSQIAQAKQNGAQAIIVSMRWGTEYSTAVNTQQKQIAQFLSDQGVSIVLGHGSHELQTVETLTGANGTKTTVWYSLGNFLSTQEPPETLFNGLAVIDIGIKSLKITKMQYLPIYMHYEWTAAQAKADNISARNNLHLYLLEKANQQMLDAQQLHTTIEAQKQRIQSTLNASGLQIPLVTSAQL